MTTLLLDSSNDDHHEPLLDCNDRDNSYDVKVNGNKSKDASLEFWKNLSLFLLGSLVGSAAAYYYYSIAVLPTFHRTTTKMQQQNHPRIIHCNGYLHNSNSTEYELTLEEWLHQPTNSSLTLCDPTFEPSNTKADMSKPVQVFIMMGQSNMLGMGHIHGDADGSLEYTVHQKKRFQHLLVKNNHINGNYNHNYRMATNWTVRHDIRNVGVFGEDFSNLYKNEWLTVSGKNFGPELQFGYVMAELLDAPILLLKSCIGNRALGWDLLPPGSDEFEYDGFKYPGYGGYPSRWPANETPTPPVNPKEWYAGKEWGT
jgi:hypothetical protein